MINSQLYDNFNAGKFDGQPTIIGMLIMMVVDTILYFLLALFFEFSLNGMNLSKYGFNKN